jgi:hypothetical protein
LFRQARGDAEDRRTFLLVTPSVVIEEEEERLVIGGVTPKVIIQEEDEDLLEFHASH